MTTGSFGVRLARIEARVSWRMSVWRQPSGEERAFPVGQIVDAWLRTLLSEPMDLDPDVSFFIANSVPPHSEAGDMEIAVWMASREVWFPPRNVTPRDGPDARDATLARPDIVVR